MDKGRHLWTKTVLLAVHFMLIHVLLCHYNNIMQIAVVLAQQYTYT